MSRSEIKGKCKPYLNFRFTFRYISIFSLRVCLHKSKAILRPLGWSPWQPLPLKTTFLHIGVLQRIYTQICSALGSCRSVESVMEVGQTLIFCMLLWTYLGHVWPDCCSEVVWTPQTHTHSHTQTCINCSDGCGSDGAALGDGVFSWVHYPWIHLHWDGNIERHAFPFWSCYISCFKIPEKSRWHESIPPPVKKEVL